MVRESDPIRPLAPMVQAPPDPSAGLPYEDEPLVNQRPPEQQRFVQLYNQVGRPRIVVFVNRTMEGDVVQSSETQPIWTMQSETHNANGPVSGSKTDVYVKPGTYDEINARALDYEAIENIMTDWIAANGQVVVTSPTLARQRLSDQTIKEMQSGRPQVLAEVAQQLNADILIQVAARPTRQTPEGVEVRLVAEAMNIKGGQSLGRAVVDMSPPLEKTQINRYTRYLARKLMDDMTQTWMAPPPPQFTRPAAAAPTPPAPQQAPAPAPAPVAPAPAPAPVAPQAPPAPSN
jgi:hypothetical protein